MIKKILRQKQIIKNISYLSVIQIISTFIPFITFPYLIKVIGLDRIGEVIFYQTIVAGLSVLLNFGFNVSAVKLISQRIENKSEVDEIFSAILYSKLIIFFMIFLVSYSALLILDVNNLLFWFCFMAILKELFVFTWLFQAIEKLKFVAITSFLSKVIYLVLILLIIKDSTDYLYVPFINGFSILFTALLSILYAHRVGVKLNKFDIRKCYFVCRESYELFITSLFLLVKNKLDIILIKFLLGVEYVAVYDFAQKMLSLFMMPLAIINNAIFAKMSREKNVKYLKDIMKIGLALSIIQILLFYPLIPYVSEYMFGEEFDNMILYIMLFSVIAFSISISASQNGLIVFGYQRQHLYSVFLTFFFYISILGGSYLIGLLTNLKVFSLIVLVTFCFEAIIRIYLLKFKKVFK